MVVGVDALTRETVMKKLVVIGVMALVAVFVALGTASSASAYPETTCNVTVNAQKVFAGTKLKVTAESDAVTTNSPRASVAGTKWRAEFDGTVHSGTADTFHTTFNVPQVDSKTTILLTVNAVRPDATTCDESLNITVLPNGTQVSPPEGGGGGLPNTGGPRMIFLIAGIVLVIAGSLAVAESRRRHDAVHPA
jgi:hypothetical protein